MLPMPGVRVQSLVGNLRPHMLQNAAKKTVSGVIEEKTTFLQKSEGGEVVSQADIWEKQETAGAKALRWVQCLACLKNSKMTTVTRVGKWRGNQKE